MKIIIAISIFCSIANCAIADCLSNRVELQVLGSGGPELNDRRTSTSYLIWLDNKAVIMVDTGGGSSSNFEKTDANFNNLLAILFTHLHVDHSADFPAYIKHSYFSRRSSDLYVYGPTGNDLMPSTSEFIQSLFGNDGAFRYLNDYASQWRLNIKYNTNIVRLSRGYYRGDVVFVLMDQNKKFRVCNVTIIRFELENFNIYSILIIRTIYDKSLTALVSFFYCYIDHKCINILVLVSLNLISLQRWLALNLQRYEGIANFLHDYKFV